ncbi:MAG: periplasmic protein [Acidobacteria bacterium]|nr:periplasmic protein [Acidobacteriota bacterium]
MKLSAMTILAMLAVSPICGFAAVPALAAVQAQPTDQEISNLIATKIASDKSLKPDAIKVTVNAGVVTLTGVVPKDADVSRVEQLARVSGVSRVENKLTSREKATDKAKETAGKVADTSKKGADKTKHALSKTGEVITDAWISSRIKTKFMGDEALRASAITVDSSDHVVTLSGAVPNAAARAKALSMAKEVEGVDRVVDKLTVADRTPRP